MNKISIYLSICILIIVTATRVFGGYPRVNNCMSPVPFPGDGYYTSPLRGVPDFGLFSSDHVRKLLPAMTQSLNDRLNAKQVADLHRLTKKVLKQNKTYAVDNIVFLSGNLQTETYQIGLLAYANLLPRLPQNPTKKEAEALINEEVNDDNARFFPEEKKESRSFFVAEVQMGADQTINQVNSIRQEYFWQNQFHFGVLWEEYNLDAMNANVYRSGEKLVAIRNEIFERTGQQIPEELKCGWSEFHQ